MRHYTNIHEFYILEIGRKEQVSTENDCSVLVVKTNNQTCVHTHTQTTHNKNQVGNNGTEDLNGAMGQML